MTDGTETITTIHIVLMALLAALTIAAIVAGMRMKRRRVTAEREVVEHAEAAGIAPDAPSGEAAAETEPAAPRAPTEREPVAGKSDDATAETAPPPPTEREPVAVERDSASSSPADGPLTQIKGLGPKVAARLGELGIDRVGQIAALDDAAAAALDADLGPFAGRMARDRWVEQARLLAAGDRDGFERVFGRL